MPTISRYQSDILTSIVQSAACPGVDANDDPERLSALAKHFLIPGEGYRTFTFTEHGSSEPIKSIDFNDLPTDDPVRAGKAIRNRIADALAPTLLECACTDSEPTVQQKQRALDQARQIAVLIGDGALKETITRPVDEQLALGKPARTSVHVAVGKPYGNLCALPAVTVSHSATWTGKGGQTSFETSVISTFSPDKSGKLEAQFDGRVYAPDASVGPGVVRGIGNAIRHAWSSFSKRENLVERPGSIEYEARLDHLMPDASGAKSSLKALHDRAKDTWIARAAAADRKMQIREMRERAKAVELKTLRPWSRFKQNVHNKVLAAYATNDSGSKVVSVPMTYEPTGKQVRSPNGKPNEQATRINQMGMTTHVFTSKEAGLDAGAKQSVSHYTNGQGGVVGRGGFRNVTGGPRDQIFREKRFGVLEKSNPGTRASPAEYGDLDSFVLTHELDERRSIMPMAGRSVGDREAVDLHAFKKASEDLKTAHERGVYHLDIKLANMVLNEQRGKPGVMKFIDTDGMVKRNTDEAHSEPKDNVSTFFRNFKNENPIASNKADDEYGFLMAMVAGRYPDKRKCVAQYAFPKKHNPQLYVAFDDFVQSHVKPAFRAEVSNFLNDPATQLLSGALHDMIDWDAQPAAPITQASASLS